MSFAAKHFVFVLIDMSFAAKDIVFALKDIV
jgi:hypothetical protein